MIGGKELYQIVSDTDRRATANGYRPEPIARVRIGPLESALRCVCLEPLTLAIDLVGSTQVIDVESERRFDRLGRVRERALTSRVGQ